MSKFSVKKPFTVVVSVIAILVLGIVAYTKMTPDLLPNMDMPYVVVMTTYPGATPEKVESSITKPMESAMATLDNIDDITSTSSANYSTLVLKFTEAVNMDTVSVDILQKINLISGGWDEMVGTPVIVKINPSMLPVSVVAVGYDNMDNQKLSTFVKDTLIPKLEGTPGVASVQTNGLLQSSVQVVLNQNKIDAINNQILQKINSQLAGAETGLNSAQGTLNQKLAELDAAKEKLKKTQGQTYDQLAKMSAQMDSAIASASAIAAQKDMLLASQAALTAEKSAYGDILSNYNGLNALLGTIAAGTGTTPPTISGVIALSQTQFAAFQSVLAGFGPAGAPLAGMSQSDFVALQQAKDTATDRLPQIDTELANLKTKIAAATQMSAQAQAGLDQMQAAYEKMLAGNMSASTEFAVGMSQIDAGVAALNDAKGQMDSSKQSFEQTRDATLKNANVADKLTMDTIAGILKAQNFSMPAGYANQDGGKVLVSVGENLTSVDQISQLLLFDLGMEGIAPIYLKDIADVVQTDNADTLYATINGKDGIMLTFSKQSTYATAAVSKNLEQKFAQLSETYEGLNFTSLMNQGDYIYLIVDSIISSLLWGAIFAILILFLFLRDIRPTFITLCSIPISVIFAVVLMYFSGVTINMISLSGLAVSVGMLVDNSVVVIENIYRLRAKGANATKAAVSGAAQVAGAIAASTLTTVCVFLPIVFVEGITRQLFADMALTIGYALIASLIVALTLVPAMSANMLKKSTQKKNKTFDRVLVGYEKLANYTLDHKWIVLCGAGVLLVVSIGLSVAKGFTFMPQMDMGQLSVQMKMAEGTTLADTKQMAGDISDKISEINGVQTVGAMLAGGGMMGMGAQSTDSVSFYVLLDPKAGVKDADVSEQILQSCADLDCEVTASGAGGMNSYQAVLGGSGVTIKVYGNDLTDLQTGAKTIAKELKQMPNLKEISDGLEKTDPAITFTVNKEAAMKQGLTTAQVYMKVSEALKLETTATTMSLDGTDTQVMVLKSDEENISVDKIKALKLNFTDATGNERTVAIGDIATITEGTTLQSIGRESQRRLLTVSAGVTEGENVTLVTKQVKDALKDVSLPEGVTYEFSGENESIMASINDLAMMMLLGILLVYLIMVAQFQSLKSPFIVMFTIPLAFTGGLLGLLLTGKEISVIAMVGFVMLSGIIVNNGIVLVDYINQLRAEGVAKREAIVQAGVTRMRPILMTSITTILGLIVMAFGGGMGTEMMQPVAIVCIGGLMYATLLTLFVVPALYDLFNKKEMRVVDDSDLEIIND